MVFLIIEMCVVLMFVGLLTRRYRYQLMYWGLFLLYTIINSHFHQRPLHFGANPPLSEGSTVVYSHFGELVMY